MPPKKVVYIADDAGSNSSNVAQEYELIFCS